MSSSLLPAACAEPGALGTELLGTYCFSAPGLGHVWTSISGPGFAQIRPEVAGPVYVSIDLDGLDPAFAPGVSHREPGGLSVRDVLNLLHTLPSPPVGADIVEFNPSQDPLGLTAYVAAKLVKELAGRMHGA